VFLVILVTVLGLALIGVCGLLLGRSLGWFDAKVVPPLPEYSAAPTATPAAPTAEPDPTPDLTVVPEATPTAEPATLAGSEVWSVLYEGFIGQGRYLEGDEPKFAENGTPEIGFVLADMDGNGTPELIARSATETVGECAVFVFTCEGESLRYLGEAGRGDPERFTFADPVYPGLFATQSVDGKFTTYYYRLTGAGVAEEAVSLDDYSVELAEDAEIETEQLTSDETLFLLVEGSAPTDRNYLTYYTPAEIRSMGWSGFVTLCGGDE